MTDAPAALQAFISATNAGDSEAFVATFTDDATLDDWGRVFRGHDGIASWNGSDNIGVSAHFELVSVAPGPQPDSVVATITVTGDGYNGTGPMTFTLEGDRIRRLVIAPTD